MTTDPYPPRATFFQMEMSEFWSGDLGLTLVTISLVVLIFVITPLRQAGLPGRFVFDLVMCCLMIFGALALNQSRIATALLVVFVLVGATTLLAGRIHPAPGLHRVGSILSTITLLLYVRIVLLVMFRRGRVTWSRMQGGVCAYLLLGMAWASAYQVVEQFRPGAFQFQTAPVNFDQLISKLTYFSFCVLTTVGSDIAPVSPIARALTIAEAVVGQLFPAILIGALVAMAMQAEAQRRTHPKS
jgi:Ion channel